MKASQNSIRMICCLFILICFFQSTAEANLQVQSTQKTKPDEIARILSKYRESKLVDIRVEKTIKSEWKTKDQIFLGKMFYSKGKFRWENETPEKNWTIYNGKILWNIQFASPDFPGKNKVTKSILTKKNRGQILLMSLLDIHDLSEKFKVQKDEPSTEKEIKLLKVKLEPLEKDPSVSKLQLVLNLTAGTIQEVSFQDDIGNLTLVYFNATEFRNEKNNKLFDYLPTKNDEVTDL